MPVIYNIVMSQGDDLTDVNYNEISHLRNPNYDS